MSNPAMRRIARISKLTLASLVIGACVTINVNFPAAATEKAADKIIDAVTGTIGAATPAGGGTSTAPPLAPPIGQGGYKAPGFLVAAVGNVLYALIPAAHAQDANLDISSPEIRAITGSMQSRFGQLQKFFDSGAVGLTQNGLIQVRDAASVSLPDRGVLTRLVAEDNSDREALYTEIAKANGHPEWAADIRKTFARRWVERGARAGWYYQNASGGWVQK
ncbi:MAG: YdbL family protein [Pseudomonadota bacterium]